MDQSLQAAVFDLDGVITLTAGLHAAAWKCVFDRVLEAHFGASFQPFDLRGDYLQYVDGRPRLNGVTTFLDSRDIQLLRGEPSDPPSQNTAWGLGNLKNELFKELLEQQGADVDAGTVALVHALRQQGVRVAVASSSRNCQPILRKAGLLELFEAIVDGKESERLRLEGKPSPDIFLEAARRLGVSPDATVVIEDATSGVAHTRSGSGIGASRGGLCRFILTMDAEPRSPVAFRLDRLACACQRVSPGSACRLPRLRRDACSDCRPPR